ncbi:cyclase [Micromonospora humidisoli]|uniref:Cyclase family protein n=2 Tax=Micromonospora TaxID=1873 RepID=A0ABS2JBC4_9ACTN|nr:MULTISPECIES: cyclase family protein [Micromonospora]MBM7083847.1 cyclase family protein [Micromonospora humidisoli]GHJ06935.1 cyclase [Micromonospora sp. AKA109]
MNTPAPQPSPTAAGSAARLVDLSHVVRHGMTTYPGLPGPHIEDHLSREESRARYAPGTEFQIGRMTLVANTGTYLDAPFHRFADGGDLSQVPLSRLVDVPGVLVDVGSTPTPGIGADAFAGCAVSGRAVLIRTGWDRHWGTEAYGAPGHPFLTAEAVSWLVSQGPAVVGIDSVNIDDMADLHRPAHTGLLATGIPIVEHLCGLAALPAEGFRFHAAPVAVAGMGTFPVRAYALVDPV